MPRCTKEAPKVNHSSMFAVQTLVLERCTDPVHELLSAEPWLLLTKVLMQETGHIARRDCIADSPCPLGDLENRNAPVRLLVNEVEQHAQVLLQHLRTAHGGQGQQGPELAPREGMRLRVVNTPLKAVSDVLVLVREAHRVKLLLQLDGVDALVVAGVQCLEDLPDLQLLVPGQRFEPLQAPPQVHCCLLLHRALPLSALRRVPWLWQGPRDLRRCCAAVEAHELDEPETVPQEGLLLGPHHGADQGLVLLH
mmetsp:Transcript_30866/g.98490  ORF Transcript_30866/g.98490 Transcript_30866/m.98490 type:complete len:252 (-) Transcript_30866:1654-2409(-)